MGLNRLKGYFGLHFEYTCPTTCILVTILLLYSFPLHADMYPAGYSGKSYCPVFSTEISMQSEEVTIRETSRFLDLPDKYFFAPGPAYEISAVFHMVNHSKNPIRQLVGFPVILSDQFETTLPPMEEESKSTWGLTPPLFPDFKVTADGQEIAGLKLVAKYFGYIWEQTFPPGASTVRIDYTINSWATHGRKGVHQVHYVLSTGRFWAGPIEEAKIVFQFNDECEPERFQKIWPAGYRLDKYSITWDMKNIVPSDDENIAIELLPYSRYQEYCKLKRHSQVDPTSIAKKIAWLKFNLDLGYTGPSSQLLGILRHMDSDTFNKKLMPLIDEKKRTWLKEYFPMKGCFHRLDDSRAYQDGRLDEIYNLIESSGFQIPFPYLDFAHEAEKLIQEILARDPKNAEVWDIYILNYAKMKKDDNTTFFKYGGAVPSAMVPLIHEAYRNCPSDYRIALWNGMIDSSKHELPRFLGWLWQPYDHNYQITQGFQNPQVFPIKDFEICTDVFSEIDLKTILECYSRTIAEQTIVGTGWESRLKPCLMTEQKKAAQALLEHVHYFVSYYLAQQYWLRGGFEIY